MTDANKAFSDSCSFCGHAKHVLTCKEIIATGERKSPFGPLPPLPTHRECGCVMVVGLHAVAHGESR